MCTEDNILYFCLDFADAAFFLVEEALPFLLANAKGMLFCRRSSLHAPQLSELWQVRPFAPFTDRAARMPSRTHFAEAGRPSPKATDLIFAA